MKTLKYIFSILCWLLIIAGIATIFTGCCPKTIERTTTKYDTTYVQKTVRDTIKIEGEAKIIDIDTTRLIHPYTAIIDSLIEVGKKKIQVKFSHNTGTNQVSIDIEQEKPDSSQVLTNTTTKTTNQIEYVNKIEWWQYIIFGISLIVVLTIGLFIGKMIK